MQRIGFVSEMISLDVQEVQGHTESFTYQMHFDEETLSTSLLQSASHFLWFVGAIIIMYCTQVHWQKMLETKISCVTIT